MSVHQTCSEVSIFHPNQQVNSHTLHWSRIWEGCSRLSGCCTPPTLVFISSSPFPLSVKLCSMSVHQSVQNSELYRIISRITSEHITSWRHTWEGCSRLSIKCTHPSLVSISCSLSPPSGKLCTMCLHRSVQDLEIYGKISRPVPISYTRENNWEGYSRLFVKYTPPSLVSISSSPSPLSSKLCSICVHRSVQDLEITA